MRKIIELVKVAHRAEGMLYQPIHCAESTIHSIIIKEGQGFDDEMIVKLTLDSDFAPAKILELVRR